MADTSISLGDIALDRLRKAVDGNGVLPSEIEMLDCTSADYELKARLTLRLRSIAKTARQAGPARAAGDSIVCKSFAELANAVREAEASPPPDWLDAARAYLRETKGDGWGFEGECPLPGLARRFAATEACIVCHGQGRMNCRACLGQGTHFCPMCRQQARIACRTCHGSGRTQADAHGEAPCPVCQGRMTEPCPQCNARGVVNCRECNGKGSAACQDCRGTGRFSETAEVTYAVDSSFGLLGDQDLPRELLRLVDRGGVASLARGHAAIEAQEPEVLDGRGATIALTARLPFGAANLRIVGKAMRVQVLGLKCAIFGLPPFLDEALADGLAALRAAGAGRGQLARALHYRIIRDALLGALRQPETVEANLIRQYPVGLSRPLIKEIAALARRALVIQSRHARWGASGGVLAGFALFCWLYFNGPIRPWAIDILPARLLGPFDFLLPLIGIAALWGAMDAARRGILRRKLGLAGTVVMPAQRLGASFFVFAVLIVLAWAIILVHGVHSPTWFKMMKIKYQAGILFD